MIEGVPLGESLEPPPNWQCFWYVISNSNDYLLTDRSFSAPLSASSLHRGLGQLNVFQIRGAEMSAL